MGVLNVTPDSFSDGGVHLRVEPAVTSAWGMLEAGAAIVDVGGESTRPGSGGVDADEELRRVEPVLADLAGAPVSIDTSKAAVARRALELGAELVNDVTALRGDPELAQVVAEGDCYLCLMHMRGEPRTMQVDPVYDDVVSDVKRFLEERLAFAVSAGIREELVCLDPGIGFGKTAAHNFELVRRLDELRALGRPLLVGFSRKSSLGALTGCGHGLGGRVGRGRGLRLRAGSDDPASARRARARRGARGREGGGGRVKIELRGLELHGFHGAYPEEERDGQLFLYDVELEVGERGADDELAHAVDYTEVAATVREVNERAVPAARSARFDPRRHAARAVRARACPRPRAQARGRAGRPPRRVQRRHRRTAMTLAYVGLGSNLGDRESLIRRAAELIGADAAVGGARDRAVGLRAPAAVS